MVIVRATRKLLQRLGPGHPGGWGRVDTLLGDWYATLLTWRPRQLLLLVSEHTLLPVLMPLAGADAPQGSTRCAHERLPGKPQ